MSWPISFSIGEWHSFFNQITRSYFVLNSTDTTSTVDLLFVLKYVTAPLGNCIQIGGSVEKCSNLFVWPDEWNTDAVNGQLYTANVDVSSANYDWSEGQYQVRFYSILFT